MRIVPVSFVKTDPTSSTPIRATKGSAGYDVALPGSFEPYTLQPGESIIIPLGWTVAIRRGYYVSLQTRSGMSMKHGIVLSNGTEAVIDSDYRGVVALGLRNVSDKPFELQPRQKVAQLLIKKHYDILPVARSVFERVFGHRKNERGTGGLGSTGI